MSIEHEPDTFRAPILWGLCMLLATLLVAGCGKTCTSVNDCYNESLGSESEVRVGGGTVTWVGRYTDNEHPVSYGVRFMGLDYNKLPEAKPVTLVLGTPVAPLSKFVESETVRFARSRGVASIELDIERSQGDNIVVSVPVEAVTARTKTSGAIVRPAKATGWYPQRYCISYIEEDSRRFTTIGVDEFALPNQPPPAGTRSGEMDDVYGC